MLVVSYLSFSRCFADTFPELVLIIDLFDLLIEFTSTKAALDIDEDG